MTKSEVAKLLAVIAAAYPKFEVDDLKVQVWHEMLGDLEYKMASLAIAKLIQESTFPPSIAEIRKAANDILHPEQTTGTQAWGEVIRAIRNYGVYREEEALASMSPRTAYVVKCMGWREICMAEELGVIRGHFLKMYQQVAEREQKEQLLPPAMRREIKQIAQLRLPESDERDNLQN